MKINYKNGKLKISYTDRELKIINNKCYGLSMELVKTKTGFNRNLSFEFFRLNENHKRIFLFTLQRKLPDIRINDDINSELIDNRGIPILNIGIFRINQKTIEIPDIYLTKYDIEILLLAIQEYYKILFDMITEIDIEIKKKT